MTNLARPIDMVFYNFHQAFKLQLMRYLPELEELR